MNLFEIDNTILNTCIDTDTGEIIDEQLLNDLEMAKEDKLLNIGRWIKNLEADAEAYEKQEKYFQERKKASTNKANSLKNYLSAYLAGQKWEAPDKSVKVSFRATKSVGIVDEKLIPFEYLKTKTEVTVNKADLLKALKDGETVPGAELVEGQSISVK